MTKLPKYVLKKFLDGEHAMCHQNGIWNSIWSDVMIETTVMRYGHGPNGMTGLTFNEKALDRWTKSLRISSIVEKSLLDIKEASTSREVNHHKEEGSSRIIEDEKDREKNTKLFVNLYTPFWYWKSSSRDCGHTHQ